MKLKFIVLASITLLFYSCKPNKEVDKLKEITNDKVNTEIIKNEGYILLRNNCYACHSVTAQSHDGIIAPPMEAVKRRYLVSYKTKKEFVNAMTNWVVDPKEENALMRGAVHQFKVMPIQPFNKDEILKITEYIFENELEKPTWFETHFEDEHPDGIGNGQGKGMGNGQSRGMGNKK